MKCDISCARVITVLILLTGIVFAQTPVPGKNTTDAPSTAKAANEKFALGILQAVKLAADNSFKSQLAHEKIAEAVGRSEISRAKLLPNIYGSVVQRNQTINLAALGFKAGSFPGFSSSLVGPFNTFDARAQFVQSIFDFPALRKYREGQADVQLSTLEEHMVRQRISVKAALYYLNYLSADKEIEAANSDLNLAESLLKLAQDQKQAGVATGVDVTRADNRMAQAQVKLSLAQTQANEARLLLLRITGLSLGTELVLTDSLSYKPVQVPVLEEAIAIANKERSEIKVAEAAIKVKEWKVSAAKAERLPSLEFIADYGENGNTPITNTFATHTVAVQLKVPIFNGGLTKGRVSEAQSQQRQMILQLADVRNQVEQEVRQAWQSLTTTQQVMAAQRSLALAEKELTMARDRFAAGVANNLEIINGQTALTNARENEVSALAQYYAARINLAASQGRAESF